MPGDTEEEFLEYLSTLSGTITTSNTWTTVAVPQPQLEIAVAPSPSAPPLRPTSKKMTLENSVKDVFRVRTPIRTSPEDCAAYFTAQKIHLPHPYPFPDRKSLVGIEVEIENVLFVDPNVRLQIWKMEEDGSLRNNGREFKTTAIPIGYVEPALNRLLTGLNPDYDFSHRTSIHIHQDVRGLQLQQLLALLFTYMVCESLLFKFAGNTRKTSIYCVPVVNTSLLRQLSAPEQLVNQIRELGHWWPKYTALNLAPISSFGTVEYRHLSGTDNIGKICAWLDLISRLKIWAYRMPYTEICALISDLNTNSQYRGFVESVFGDACSLLDLSDLLSDMEEAVTAVRNCVITNKFHQSLKFSSKSPYAVAIGLGPVSKILSPERLAVWQEWCRTYWPGENQDTLYHTVKTRIRDYSNHSGKDGTKMLNIVFEKESK